MKISGFLALASCALLVMACGDDSSSGSGNEDAGFDAGGSGTSEDAGPAEMEPEEPRCTTPPIFICDDGNIVERSQCDGAAKIQDTCPAACYRAQCVTCAPNAGALCLGQDVWAIDSCGGVETIMETCSGRCSGGACVADNCVEQANRVCVDGTVFYEDSCGNRGVQVADRCTTGCTDGRCDECVDGNQAICFSGAIWRVDSCGQRTALIEDCGPDACVADAGGLRCESGVSCNATGSAACVSGIAYELDTCGGVTDALAGGTCFPCSPHEIGRTCDGNDVVELTGGCNAGDMRSGDILESCQYGCAQGQCLEADACVPNAGITCRNGDSYSVDSCGKAEDVLEVCTDGCDVGRCRDCSGFGSECFVNDLYRVDGCGRRQELIQTCTSGCADGRCTGGEVPGELVCNCDDGFPYGCGLSLTGGAEGPIYTCAGCWDSSAAPGSCSDVTLCTETCGAGVECLDGTELYIDFEISLGSCGSGFCAGGCADPLLCSAFECGFDDGL